MKKSKKNIVLCIVTAIMMVFAVVPYMGSGAVWADTAQPNKAEGFSINERIQYAKSDDTTVYTKTFEADETNVLKLTKASASMSDSPTGIHGDSAPSITVKDTYGETLQPTSSGSEGYIWEFESAGTYTLTVKCSLGSFYSNGTVLVYRIEGELADAGSSVEGFEYVNAKFVEMADVKIIYAEIEAGNYTGSDNSAYIVLREDKSDGTIMCIEDYNYSNFTSDATIKYDKTYKYYIVPSNTFNYIFWNVDYAKGSQVEMTADQIAQLETIAGTAELTTPVPPVGVISNLTNTSTVKQAALKWKCDDLMYVSGYRIQKYNSAGKLMGTYIYPEKEAPMNPVMYAITYAGTFKFKVTPFYEYNGSKYFGEPLQLSVASAKIKPATAGITKISNTNAKMTIKKAEGSTGTIIYQKVGTKWKQIKKTTATKFTWTKNKAGTAQYKFKSYIVDEGKTYLSSSFSKIYKPATNARVFNLSSNVSSYEDMSHFWRPVKLYYNNGKVMLTGKFINTHIYRVTNIKVKVTVKCDGKLIGTTTISSGAVGSNCIKTHAAKSLGKKAGLDLANGNVSWSYTVVDWY